VTEAHYPVPWTEAQRGRLKALLADDDLLQRTFAHEEARDRAFRDAERELVQKERERLARFRAEVRRPALCRLQEALAVALREQGFLQVATPTLMNRSLLARMGIDDTHPLSRQIYWVDGDKCLRPMLAPHLYVVLKDLLRLLPHPVRIFEIGSCFRKESQGHQHAGEFTMLNLVEMGLDPARREEHFRRWTSLVMETAGITNYRLESAPSEVYGQTLDVTVGDPPMEVASGAFGPHPLDGAWKIRVPWVGVGFGLERLILAAENRPGLARAGRSLIYLDGISLHV